GVQGVPHQAVIAVALVLPWPEDVGEQEADTTEDSESSPDAHGTGSSLFCRIIGYRETFLAVCNGDVIQFSAQASKIIIAHGVQFLGGVLLIRVITHERDPIHIAAAMRTMMPMPHMNRPSETGPRPPSE